MGKKETLLLLQMIQEATQWLLELAESEVTGLQPPESQSFRVFTEEECESLSLTCRRFLLSLEQQGILNAGLRERIIYHAMELQVKNIDLHVVEGITRIVLSRQPEGMEAIKRMELLMTKMDNLSVH